MSERKVYVVWDGGPSVAVPPPMGEPRDDQLQGTLAEQVAELACRCCYNSLGAKRSRSSEDNLRHILEVGHLSVVEHYHHTFCLMFATREARGAIAECLAQRPGVYWRFVRGGAGAVRITLNARAMLEWSRYTEEVSSSQEDYPQELAFAIGSLLRAEWCSLAPVLFPHKESVAALPDLKALRIGSLHPVKPEHQSEVWISLYMEGSRGFSHELVRHGNFTAISQRSTRYVNEADSPWDWHPLIYAYLDDQGGAMGDVEELGNRLRHDVENLQDTYRQIVRMLRSWLIERGVDKFTARKQARGAARGFLGNALRTAVIFTANVPQWRHMMRMRAADAADAEIRGVFAEALPLLKSGCYGTMFEDLQLGAASDGLGLSLVGGGAQ